MCMHADDVEVLLILFWIYLHHSLLDYRHLDNSLLFGKLYCDEIPVNALAHKKPRLFLMNFCASLYSCHYNTVGLVQRMSSMQGSMTWIWQQQ